MRWTYTRLDETIVCELGLSDDASGYSLRIESRRGTKPELFGDAMAAFQRQAAMEKRLVAEGWSLEAFDFNRGR